MNISFIRRSILPATVFLTGACVLVIEVVAVRVLAPFFGTTLYTVSSILAIILFALSCGYAIGGRLADAYPSLRIMYTVIFFAGVAVLLCYGFGVLILPYMSQHISLTWGALLASFCLFFVPASLLGMLSPYAVVLQDRINNHGQLGRTSGTMFFWSTLGSIVGSLSSGFYLIPHFGVKSIMIGCGVVLCVIGIVPQLVRGKLTQVVGKMAVLGMVSVFAWGASSAVAARTVVTIDGVYEHISVFDHEYNGRPTRFLQQDLNTSASKYMDSNDPTDLPFEYTQYYALYRFFVPHPQRVLAIGGGAYSVPMAVAHEQPQAEVTVVEIEPRLFDLVQEYFDITPPDTLHNVVDDGRHFLATHDTRYDFIFSDVYQSKLSIPPHFVTQEFFTLAKQHLTESGVFVANVIGTMEARDSSFLLSEMRTFQSVFPATAFFSVNGKDAIGFQNVIFVGWTNPEIDPLASVTEGCAGAVICDLPQQRIDVGPLNLERHAVFTDDYAPVEYMMTQDFLRQ